VCTAIQKCLSLVFCTSHQLFPRLERADKFAATVALLEEQLKEQAREMTKVRAHCSYLESQRSDLEVEIARDRDTVQMLTWTIEQLKSSNQISYVEIEELKSNANSLEADLVSAAAEISRLTDRLELERQTRLDEREQLTAELAGERGRHTEARDEIETLSSSLEQIKFDSNEIITQWMGTF
jgi:chromosome segregation ATPase